LFSATEFPLPKGILGAKWDILRVEQDALRANEDLSRVKKDVLRVSSEAVISRSFLSRTF
jgi:hypothetical protein